MRLTKCLNCRRIFDNELVSCPSCGSRVQTPPEPGDGSGSASFEHDSKSHRLRTFRLFVGMIIAFAGLIIIILLISRAVGPPPLDNSYITLSELADLPGIGTKLYARLGSGKFMFTATVTSTNLDYAWQGGQRGKAVQVTYLNGASTWYRFAPGLDALFVKAEAAK